MYCTYIEDIMQFTTNGSRGGKEVTMHTYVGKLTKSDRPRLSVPRPKLVEAIHSSTSMTNPA